MIIFMALVFSLTSVWAEADSASNVDLQFAFKGGTDRVTEILDLQSKDAKERQVFLLDTLNLDLFHRNIQIRLRMNGERAQLAVKQWGLSRVQYEELNSRIGNCEIDVHGPVIVHSCAAKSKISAHTAKHIVAGQPVLPAMDDKQVLLLANAQLPIETLQSIVALGPVNSVTWSWDGANGEKFNVDFQTTPDDRLFRELSVKTEADDFLDQWVRVRAELREKGLKIARRQNGRRLEKLTSLLTCARSLTL